MPSSQNLTGWHYSQICEKPGCEFGRTDHVIVKVLRWKDDGGQNSAYLKPSRVAAGY